MNALKSVQTHAVTHILRVTVTGFAECDPTYIHKPQNNV